MKNERLCLSGARDQHEDKDGEESLDGRFSSAVALISSERCPICLNNLPLEVGFPEDCCHAFCISCILKWSEMSSSCPVDRKPFQTVYKIDGAGVCTKIPIVARLREDISCSCSLCTWCCTKSKICFRIEVNQESTSKIMCFSTTNGCRDQEKSDFELSNLNMGSLSFNENGTEHKFDHLEASSLINGEEIEEEPELHLIQQKREVLSYLRLPATIERVESNTLSVQRRILSLLSLDEYIFPSRPLLIRNNDFSARTCVRSRAKEGTEKKQASSSKGTRRKSAQSNARRRSTRNSKSDVGHLQSSSKSSNSDNDTPGCNSSSTDTQSSEHPKKQPAKQRKQAPKKAAPRRKRLRSATQTREDSDKSKENSESESEQEEKKIKMPDMSDTAPYETSDEKGHQQVEDESLVLSPMDQSLQEDRSALSPMQNVQSPDKEVLVSPAELPKECDSGESAPCSPVFTNGQVALEKSQQASTFEQEFDSVVETKLQLNTEVEHSENMQVSEGECQDSPLYVKHTDTARFDRESASSPVSENESESHEKDLISPASSEDIPDAKGEDFDIGEANVQSPESSSESLSTNSSPSRTENFHGLDQVESSKTEQSISSDVEDLEKQLVLEHSSGSCDSTGSCANGSETHESQNLELLVQDGSFLSEDGKEVNGEKISLQESKLTEVKTCLSAESEQCVHTDTTANSGSLPEKATVDAGEAEASRLCSEDLQSLPVGTNKAGSSELCTVEDDGKISDSSDKVSDLKSEQKVAINEDDNESVAMECDSVCSDRVSDIEKPAEKTKTVAEPKSLVSTKTEELELTEKSSAIPYEDAPKKESRPRRSRFHSPSTTWSPTKSDVKEGQRSRSRSKNKDSPVKRKSRSHSRERDRNHAEQWKGRSRDRHHRRQSRSRSRSRSTSESRTRNRNRSNVADRNEKSSPPWRDRRSNDNWKSPRGSDRYRRNEHEKTHEHFRAEKDSSEKYPDNKNDYPDWVSEKIKSMDSRGRGDGWMRGDGRGRGWGDNRGRGRGENRTRGDLRGRGDFRGRGDIRGRGDGRGRGGNRGRGSPRGPHWEDNLYNSGDSWNRNTDWNSPRGRGGRGRGGFRGGFNFGDQNENSWNSRQPYSGNNLGQESIRHQEYKNYKLKHEENFESPADRSGWTSASSWAVRKTLPADVQNYYSKRGRSSTGSQPGWPKTEGAQDQGDQAVKDQPSQPTENAQMPINIVQPQMNVVQPPMTAPPQPVNIYPYSVAVPPPVTVPPPIIQHNPYNMHPQLPIHLHPALPLVQVSVPSSVPQVLPPPPPPPPPSQQVTYVAPQQDGKPLQKIQIQERAAHEVKVAIKQYYQNKDITKDEYKEIVKKAVDKVCHSKSGEVDSAKVANLVKAYVDKYKHSRKKGTE